MPVPLLVSLPVVSLFLAMLAMLELGRRMGARHGKEQEVPADVGLLNGAVFGLMGFLVALTYSGADSRLYARRQQIVEEANTISSAYQLLDLIPAEAQPKLRETFRRYVDSRIAVFQHLPDVAAALKELDRSETLQKEIWRQTVIATRKEPTSTTTVMLPAMNRMADIANMRTWTVQTHVVVMTFGLLFVIALTCSLLAGFSIGRGAPGWLHRIAFAAIIAATLYVIIELEFPRAGLVQIHDFDQVMINVRNTMN